METRRIRAEADLDGIEEAAALLSWGALVAFPTETVYGLGALGLRPDVLEKVFRAKERPREDPLILHVADSSWLDELVAELPDEARALAAALWPGPLTMVLRKSRKVPDLATAGLPSVALRMPAHPVARELIRKVGEPLAAPSANRFGHTSPTTADHVLADLNGRIDAVLDAGPTPLGLESTVVDLRVPGRPLILRPGGASRERIEAVLGMALKERDGSEGEGAPQVSPGLLARHYSPRARLCLFHGAGGQMGSEMLRAIESAARRLPGTAGVLAYDEDIDELRGLPVGIERLGSVKDKESVARNLFSAMRRLDGAGHALIFARTVDPEGLGEAINDRLSRAACRDEDEKDESHEAGR